MRIKICGITQLEDAQLAAQLGAWAIGFNFYRQSPRYIAPTKAKEMAQSLPENILKVGIFVNEQAKDVSEIFHTVGLDAVQLYGTDETTEGAYPGLKIFCHHQKIKNKGDLFLLDVDDPRFGGTGKKSNWQRAAQLNQEFPVILAGGIGPHNVKEAMELAPFYALDVCSGVEKEKGIKCPQKMNQLFENVRSYHA